MRSNKSIREGKKEIIIDLRNKGYSYDKIKKETGYGKGAISYHCGEGQKEKQFERCERQRKGFKRKVWGFIYGQRKPKKPFVYGTTEIRKKGREFFFIIRYIFYKCSKFLLFSPHFSYGHAILL